MNFKGIDLPEIYFEIRSYEGTKTVKVSAIDPGTGTEVSMVGAPGYDLEDLKLLAARKLAYVLSKKNKDKS